MDAGVGPERFEETPQQHQPSPIARRLPPDFAGDAAGFRLSAGGERGEIGRGVVISHNYFTNINLFKYDNKRSIRIGE